MQDRRAEVVAERDPFEHDVAEDGWQHGGIGGLDDGGIGGDELLQLRHRGLGLLVHVVGPHHLLDRLEEGPDVQHERGQLADAEVAVVDHRATDEEDQELTGEPTEFGGGRVDAGDPCGVVAKPLPSRVAFGPLPPPIEPPPRPAGPQTPPCPAPLIMPGRPSRLRRPLRRGSRRTAARSPVDRRACRSRRCSLPPSRQPGRRGG